jgi:CBS domain-containing protein
VTELTERAVTERVPGLIDEKLKVLSRRDPVTVRPGTSLQTCLELIRETGMADSVFVTDEKGRLLGVLTERDIFARLVGPDADLGQPVEQLMIDHPNTLHLDQPVRRAVELMQTGKFRNVPLVDDDNLLVGVVRPGTSLQTCLELIRETGMADSVFVTDEKGRLLGVLTERDIFARLVGPDADLGQPVEKLMIDHPNTLHLDQPVRRAVELMQTGKFRNVPLVDDDNLLVGVVRPVDLLKYLAEAFPEELLNLPPRPHQRMAATEGA